MIWVYLGIVVLILALASLVRVKRRAASSTAYRRHIDALSPASRRATLDGKVAANGLSRRKR